MLNKKIFLSLLTLGLITSCSNQVIIKSPNEDKGLEGNQDQDQLQEQTVYRLKNLLNSVAKKTRYSFDVTVNIPGYEEHVVYYVTPYALYEEADNKEDSVGYAMTKDNYIFKFYLSDDEKTCYPSVYEYSGYDGDFEKVKDLYGPFSFAHISMLSAEMDDFSAIKTGVNKFSITDSDVASVFQYMTNYGTFVTNYMNSLNIEVINFETEEFKVNLDLGTIGSIDCVFTPLTSTKIDFVSTGCYEQTIEGVDYYDDTLSFFNKVKQNNFVLEGIKQIYPNGNVSEVYPYRINCTNDYFYLSYTEDFTNSSYKPFGFALVEKGTSITYKTVDSSNQVVSVTQTLDYDACYSFTKDPSTNEFYYNGFIGPLQSSGLTYLEVDELPSVGESSILYITKNENGDKVVYEWIQTDDDSFKFIEYSSWYNSVGEFPINGKSATFYLGGTPLCDIGPQYFEKDNSKNDTYYCKNDDILSSLAVGLFGWGFQPTDTWMDSVFKANLIVNKDNDEIIGGDIGLSVTASSATAGSGELKIYYSVSDFGNANLLEIEEFLKGEN